MENTYGDDDHDHGGGGIPGDVLIQILVWLPVISLLRFKSVCKSWRDLIESSFFIHLHAAAATTLTTSSSSNKFGTLIFQIKLSCDPTETGIVMLTPSRRRRSDGDGGGGEVFEMEDLRFPPFYYNSDPAAARWKLVGSCNGLICSKLGRVVSLSNPATRQFRILPKSSSLTLEEEEDEKIGRILVQDEFGFGFDVKTMDYKVVQITNFSLPEKMEFRVQVYSLSTNSWRRVLEDEDMMISLFPKHPFQGFFDMILHGLYLNGRFFFNGFYGNENGLTHWVFSFDFTNEIFTPIKQFRDTLKSTILILTYFGADKIAFSTAAAAAAGVGETTVRYLDYGIWVLNNTNEHEHDQKEEEEEESYYWTKLQHSIPTSTGDNSSCKSFNTPLAISEDGKFALIETSGYYGNRTWDSKLQLLNLVTKEEKIVFSSDIMGMLRARVYKPSLVSVIGGGNGNGTAADDRVVIGGAL